MSLSKAALDNLTQLADKIPTKNPTGPSVTEPNTAPQNEPEKPVPEDVISIHASPPAGKMISTVTNAYRTPRQHYYDKPLNVMQQRGTPRSRRGRGARITYHNPNFFRPKPANCEFYPLPERAAPQSILNHDIDANPATFSQSATYSQYEPPVQKSALSRMLRRRLSMNRLIFLWVEFHQEINFGRVEFN